MTELIICAVVFALVLLLTLGSHFVYHRSLMATVVEWYLRLTEKHYTEEELRQALDERIKNGDVPYELPRGFQRRSGLEQQNYEGMQVFCINREANCDKAVIYLHGGAYYRKPRRFHIRFIEKASRECKLPFFVPIYKKAPNHRCAEVYDTLRNLYVQIRGAYKTVILMGDSSGGGLALGLTLYVKEAGLEAPNGLILLSPWVDVSLENRELAAYVKKDPIVCLDNVRLLGRTWAGELPLSDYRVSPIHGDMRGLCSTHIFCGTRELLYPDCCLLHETMQHGGADVHFYRGEGQNHVYPIYPIPEGRRARKIIEGIINGI